MTGRKMEVKRIPISEFRRLGYLQELNRRFLHPLGLAIESVINEDGSESLGGVWDYRDDPEGMLFNLDLIDTTGASERAQRIDEEIESKRIARINACGAIVQPISISFPLKRR